MVFSQSLLRTRVLARLQTSLSQMRREDFQRRRSRDSSKRLRRTRRPMSRERTRLRPETTWNSLSTRLSIWSRTIRSRTSCLRRTSSQFKTSALSYTNGWPQIQMPQRTNMMPRELILRRYSIQFHRRFMDRDRDSQVPELKDKDSQELMLSSRIMRTIKTRLISTILIKLYSKIIFLFI